MSRTRLLVAALLAASLSIGLLVHAQVTNLMNTGLRVDTNGNLMVASGAYSGTQGPVTNAANLGVKTDSNSALLVAMSGASVFAVGTAGAPSISFAGFPASGLFSLGPGNMAAVTNGVTRWETVDTGIQLKSDASLQWSSGVVNAASDVTIARAAAGELTYTTLAFSALGTPAAGTVALCTDCGPTTAATCPATKASCVCTSGGLGSIAIRVNNLWYCPF